MSRSESNLQSIEFEKNPYFRFFHKLVAFPKSVSKPHNYAFVTNPDWIRPYAEAFQTPHSGGQIKYDLRIENSNGGLVRAYIDNYKTVLSTSWRHPTQWDEIKYYNVHQYDQVLVEGRAESWN